MSWFGDWWSEKACYSSPINNEARNSEELLGPLLLISKLCLLRDSGIKGMAAFSHGSFAETSSLQSHRHPWLISVGHRTEGTCVNSERFVRRRKNRGGRWEFHLWNLKKRENFKMDIISRARESTLVKVITCCSYRSPRLILSTHT